MWWQILAALIGFGLMAAPDWLGLPEATGTLVSILAPVASAMAVIAASEVTRSLRWASASAAAVLGIGVLLLGAPMPELGLVVGAALVMAVMATCGGGTGRTFGGGWRSLLD